MKKNAENKAGRLALGCVALASVWATFETEAYAQYWAQRAANQASVQPAAQPAASRAAQVEAEATARAAGTARPMVAEAKDDLDRPSGRKAFLVGASDYNRDVADLPCVKNDVEALAQRLVEIGFEEHNVTVLTDGVGYESMPIKENIEERFAEFVEDLQPGDFVIVYLSGHGIQPSDSKEAFFAPVDVKANAPFETAVSIDKMMQMLEESDAQCRLMIVDACRNDPTKTQTRAMFKTRATSDGVRALAEIESAPKSVSLLQSCQPGQYSYEGGDGNEHGVFTMSLLEALDPTNSKPNANGDQELTFGEIFTYVSARTNELAKTLHGGVSQRPHLNNKDGFTDFVVLEKLTKDGISDEKWQEAHKYYLYAVEWREKKNYDHAKHWIAEARKINAVNPDYIEEESRINELVEATAAAAQAIAAAEQARAEAAQANAAAAQSRQAAQGTQYTQPTQQGAGWGDALDAARQIPYVGGYLPF